MAKKLFIAATGQNIGKTTASLSLVHLAKKKYQRVGFIKPLGPKVTEHKGVTVDTDAALICQIFGMGRNLPYMSPVVIHPDSTRKATNGEIDLPDLEKMMLEACAEMEKKGDADRPVAFAVSKKAISQGSQMALTQALDYEASLFANIFDTKDQVEGTTAFVEKRKPEFKGE